MMKLRRGFTLMELLIAVSIFAVVATTIFSSFRAGLFGFRNIEDNIYIYQAAGQIIERLDNELRNAFVYSVDKESKFSGSASGISFLTLVDTFTKAGVVKDYALVSYQLSGNKLMRLCRRNQESLNSRTEIKPEEMAADVSKISFSYGYADSIGQPLSFKDSWGDGNAPDEQKALPKAVKVTLGIKGKKTQEFERTIYLPLGK